MKNKMIILFIHLISFIPVVYAQKYKITWGDENKMKRGTSEMDLIYADNSGSYLLLGQWKMKSFFIVGATYKSVYALVKYDKNFNLVYDKDYTNDFKDVGVNNIASLKDRLYAFTYSYDKKAHAFHIYGVEIDKNTGELKGSSRGLADYTIGSDDEINVVFKPTPDSSQWMMVTNIIGKDKSYKDFSAALFDDNLVKRKSADFMLNASAETFSVLDIFVTKDEKILLYAKEFEMVEVKRKKIRPVFKNYSLSVFSMAGKKEAAINLNAGEKFIISGKLIPLSTGELIYAGFYSASPDKKKLNGINISKVDAVKGVLIQSSFKDITKDMLNISDSAATSEAADTQDEDDKSSKKDKTNNKNDENESFDNTFVIRSVLPKPGNDGIVITAESFRYVFQEYTRMSTGSQFPTTVMKSYYFNKDLMIINVGADGSIQKIKYLPKRQIEEIGGAPSGFSSYSGDRDPLFSDFFVNGPVFPFYSSIASVLLNNKLIFFFNDDERNANVLDQTDSKSLKNVNSRTFKKSAFFAVTYDLKSGDTKRSIVFKTDSDIIPMPRLAYFTGNELYIPAGKVKIMTKPNLKIGHIVIE